MLTGWIGLAVGAPSEEELERRVGVLGEQLRRYAAAPSRWASAPDVLRPSPARGRRQSRADYVQQLTVEQFGAMVATATRTVGSQRGPYLGYTPTGAPLAGAALTRRRHRGSTAPPRCCWSGRSARGRPSRRRRSRMPPSAAGASSSTSTRSPTTAGRTSPSSQESFRCSSSSGDPPSQQGALTRSRSALKIYGEELACSYLLELLRDPPRAWENAISRAVKTRSARAHTACCVSSSCSAKATGAATRSRRGT